MFRIAKYALFCASAFIIAISLNSCKSKTKEDSKRDLLEAIEHYNIDPVDTTGKAPLGSHDVNDILCHYPELYHATEQTQKLYNKWADTEREMIACVFVGKQKLRVANAAKRQSKLDERLKTHNVTNLLEYALLGIDQLALEEWSSDEATSDLYLKIMAAVADGQVANKDHAATDEMRSAVGYARRAWKDYQTALQKIIDAVPESARTRYIKAVNDALRLHYIDLNNRYFSYYEDTNPGWLLQDNASDEDIQNFEFQGLHDRDWIDMK